LDALIMRLGTRRASPDEGDSGPRPDVAGAAGTGGRAQEATTHVMLPG
jgi:hypothetical protein